MISITYKKLTELKPYEKNPRRNDEAVGPVAESIRQFGFKVPIIIDRNNVIVAGHTRYKASKKLKLEEVPCIVADDLNEDQIKAFRLADNKVGEFAEWDMDLLAEELAEIDMSMDVFGFEEFDLDDDSPDAEEDYYEPELPDAPKAQYGDIYRLGDHLLMCGDCTKEEDVLALTDGEEMDLCVTDPPYNVNYGNKVDTQAKYFSVGSRDDSHIANDYMDNDSFFQFLLEFYSQMLGALKAGGAFYIWHAESEGLNFRSALKEAGGKTRQCLVWNKSSLVLGFSDYQWKHEPCLYGWKDGAGHYFTKDRSQATVIEDHLDIDKMTKEEMKKLLHEIYDENFPSTVIDEAKPQANDLHPTMKPIKLIARLISNSSRKHEKVVDFFGGSGSTLIACEQLDRKCYMMELDPKYVDVIIDRWETFTGEKAVKIR